MKSNYEPLGKHIRLVDYRNSEEVTSTVLGISIGKEFMPSVANVIGTDLSRYKLISKGLFACNPMHVGRDERLPIALYEKDSPAIVSPAYFMFEIIDRDVLNEEYLMMWFRRPEFDRECWFMTDGSVRGGITWDDLCRMRVGEMIALNRDDINFNERECVVFGKGSKERIVYFDARTKIHLQNYLESRTDTCSALFVSLTAPHDRLQIGGVERRLRELGKRLNLPRVHPHKFRRTLATSAIDKGMPIEQVQQLLGHQKIDTTMHYAMVKQQNVKLAHRKYIG